MVRHSIFQGVYCNDKDHKLYICILSKMEVTHVEIYWQLQIANLSLIKITPIQEI